MSVFLVVPDPNAFASEYVSSELYFGFFSGPRNSRECPILRACLFCGSTRDSVPSRGDGSERGGRTRPREADLASTAAGGHDHTVVTGVHCLSALRENTAAGTDSIL